MIIHNLSQREQGSPVNLLVVNTPQVLLQGGIDVLRLPIVLGGDEQVTGVLRSPITCAGHTRNVR